MNILYGPLEVIPKIEPIAKPTYFQSTGEPSVAHVNKTAINASEFVSTIGQQRVSGQYSHQQSKYRDTQTPSTGYTEPMSHPKPFYTQAPQQHQLPSHVS